MIVVSTPAWRKIGEFWLSKPSSSDLRPSSVPLRAKVSRPASGPATPPSIRLNPVPLLTPNGSSVSTPRLPWYSLPPVLVTIDTMPDLAFPNSAELDPVVTEASSNALVLMLSEEPSEPTKASPR